MSTAPATDYAVPRRPSTTLPVERPLRRVEIVPDRAQRRARPRLAYAIIAVAGVFAIIIAQLLLSIVVSEGAYRISGLQTEKAQLVRTEQSLQEKADVLASAQNLAIQAAENGMVPSASGPAFLDPETGSVSGARPHPVDPDAAAATVGSVPNQPLTDLDGTGTTDESTAKTADATAGKSADTTDASVPPVTPTTPDVASDGVPTVRTQ
jgi:hypothetical protein